VEGVESALAFEPESSPMSRERPKAAASASTTMTPMRTTFLREVLRRCARSSSYSRACRLAF
jgi:hypothetical protein